MLLHASRDASSVGRVAEPLFYPLWDAGFSVGNAVRTMRECAAVAGQRIDAATALLDARFLAGDGSLFEDLHDRTLKDIRRDPLAFVGRLRDGGLTRRDRYGSVSHLLEPELKEGSGGLRDVQAMSWTAWAVAGRGDLRALEDAGLLRASERSALEAAHEFLMRLRSALHLDSATRTDRVLIDAQPDLAREFGFEDEPGVPAVDGLMRATLESGRMGEHVTESLWARILGPRSQGAGSAEPEDAQDPGPAEGVLALVARAASGD